MVLPVRDTVLENKWDGIACNDGAYYPVSMLNSHFNFEYIMQRPEQEGEGEEGEDESESEGEDDGGRRL